MITSKRFIDIAMRGVAGIIAVSLAGSLAGCGTEAKANERFQQALAAKAYNDVSACYGITDLKASEGNGGSAKPSAFTEENADDANTATDAVWHAGDDGMTAVPAMAHVHVHVSPHVSPHVSLPHSSGSHSSGGETGHSSGSVHGDIGGGRDFYTAPKSGSESGSSKLSSETLHDAKTNRSKGKLMDGTNHDGLITDDATHSWYSRNHYYMPFIYSQHALADNADKTKDGIAYELAKYVEGATDGDSASKNVGWKHEGKDYTGFLSMYRKDKDKYAKLTPANADGNALKASCPAVKLPTVDEISKLIGDYKDKNHQ